MEGDALLDNVLNLRQSSVRRNIDIAMAADMNIRRMQLSTVFGVLIANAFYIPRMNTIRTIHSEWMHSLAMQNTASALRARH